MIDLRTTMWVDEDSNENMNEHVYQDEKINVTLEPMPEAETVPKPIPIWRKNAKR